MPKWMSVSITAVVVFTLCGSSFGALKTADVPTFKLRARIAVTPVDQPGKIPPRHTFSTGEGVEVFRRRRMD